MTIFGVKIAEATEKATTDKRKERRLEKGASNEPEMYYNDKTLAEAKAGVKHKSWRERELVGVNVGVCRKGEEEVDRIYALMLFV